ncbi:MAG: hypothetical protein M3Z24_16800 [Chloroflexota bacterium]|nr:hypothetical protein [Chloroflexota bacterium]
MNNTKITNSRLPLISLILLAFILSGVFLTVIYRASIEAVLSLPPHTQVQPVMPQLQKTAKAPVAMSSVATNMPTRLLAQDTFQRPNQQFWGQASDGQTWQADANNNPGFSIVEKMGQVSNGSGSFNATLGPMAANVEVVFTGSISAFPQSNMGSILRWNDASNWYKAYIDGKNLIIIKKVGGITMLLKMVPFVAAARTAYTLRFRVIGTTLAAKAWLHGTPEPQMWMVQVTDTSLAQGFGGLRLLLGNGIVAAITSFQEFAISV